VTKLAKAFREFRKLDRAALEYMVYDMLEVPGFRADGGGRGAGGDRVAQVKSPKQEGYAPPGVDEDFKWGNQAPLAGYKWANG